MRQHKSKARTKPTTTLTMMTVANPWMISAEALSEALTPLAINGGLIGGSMGGGGGGGREGGGVDGLGGGGLFGGGGE